MPLSSQRQRFSIFVSPRNEDFLFYEKVDKQRVQESIPKYGDPHPDYRKYPNHFFAQAIQADEEGQVYYYYYAAQRQHQDDYNWEHTSVDYQSLRYDMVERTYVLLRTDFDHTSPALGSAMPVTESDPFDEGDGYVLTSRKEARIGDAGRRSTKVGDKELDSLFVLERRFYIKRVPITTSAYDKNTGSHIFRTTNLVHRDEKPVGADAPVSEIINDPTNDFWEVDEETGSHKQIDQVSEQWYFVTTITNGDANDRRVFVYLSPDKRDYIFYELVDRKDESALPDPDLPYGSAHSEFTNHVFVAAVANDNTGDFYRYYYAAPRVSQDNHNWRHTTTDLGGARYSTVTRNYVIPRVEYSDSLPALGSSMPITTGDPFEAADDYILLSRKQESLQGELAELDSVFVVEARTFIKRTPLTQTTYDKATGFHTFRSTKIYHASETPTDGNTNILSIVEDRTNLFWEVDDSDGAHREVEQLSSEWFAVVSVFNNESTDRRVFLYLTPNQNDFVFYEIVDRKDETNQPEDLPSYGDSHPNFGQHKFVAAEPADSSGDLYRYYYAKDRLQQDEYNFSHSFLDVGGIRVDVVRRTYVSPRESYSEDSPPLGSEMPINGFSSGYKLVERSQRPIDDKTLSSLYVNEERVYVLVPDISNQENNYTLREGQLSLVRSWIVPRSEVGGFNQPDVGSSDNTYGDYKFATRQISQDTPPELDSYYAVVLDLYAKQDYTFQQNQRFEIGYKVIEESQLVADIDPTIDGTYSATFGERGWQQQKTTYELTGFEYQSKTEVRPYGTLTTNTSASESPYEGEQTSRSRIVFDDGNSQVYQTDIDTFAVKEGDAGVEKRSQAFVNVTTNRYYRQSADISTTSGSSRVIFDDGLNRVYLVEEESAAGKYGDAGQSVEQRAFVTLNTNSTYAPSGTVTGNTGRSRVVYNDGTLIIYQVDNTTATPKYGDAGQTKEEREFVRINTNSVYAASGDVTGNTGRSRVVYNDGQVTVYQVDNETATAKYGDAGQISDERPFLSLSTNIIYSPSGAVTGSTGRSRLVYNDGVVKVYRVENTSTTGKFYNAGTEIEERPYVKFDTDVKYSGSGEVTGDTGRSKVVYSDSTTTVYEVDDVYSSAKEGEAGQTYEQRPYAEIRTDSYYRTSGVVSTPTGKSRLLYNDRSTQVYQVDEIYATPIESFIGEDKEERPYLELTTNKRYSTSNTIATSTGSSRIIYTDGNIRVYELSEENPVAKEGQLGEEKESRNFVDITRTTRYSLSDSINQDEGSSRIIYTNGVIKIYEIKELTTSTIKEDSYISAKRPEEWGFVQTETKYQPTPQTSKDVSRVRLIYNDQFTKVYELEEDTIESIKAGKAVTAVDKELFGPIETSTEYKNTPDTNEKKARVRRLYDDGIQEVYEVRSEKLGRVEQYVFESSKERRQYGKVVISKRYSDNPQDFKVEKSSFRTIFDDGVTKVYEYTEEELEQPVEEADIQSRVSVERWGGEIEVQSRYALSANKNVKTKEGQNSLVYDDGTTEIYQVDEQFLVNSSDTASDKDLYKEQDVRDWGVLDIDVVYNQSKADDSAPETHHTLSTRVVYFGSTTVDGGGEVTVFEHRRATVGDLVDEHIVSERTDKYKKTIVTRSYIKRTNSEGLQDIIPAKESEDSARQISARVVYSDSANYVIQLDTTTFEAESTKDDPLRWDTTVNYSLPRVLEDIVIIKWALKQEPTGVSTQVGDKYYKREFPIFLWKRHAYTGPVASSVEEYWTEDSSAGLGLVTGDNTTSGSDTTLGPLLQPTTATFASPKIQINLGPCLHGEHFLSWDPPEQDPIYYRSGDAESDNQDADPPFEIKDGFTRHLKIPATEQVDWPDSIVIEHEMRPDGDVGFIVRKVTVDLTDLKLYDPFSLNSSSP